MRSVAADVGIPERFGPAVDAYVALGAVGLVLTTVHVANALAGEFFSHSAAVGAYYGVDGLATWVALKLGTYGLVGVGGTYLYVRAAGVEVTAALPDRADARLAGGAVVAAVGAAGVALGASQAVGVGLPWLLSNTFGRAVAVRGIANPAPDALVLGVVVGTRVLVVAPALAVVVHGILQPALEDAGGPAAGVAVTAVLVGGAWLQATASAGGATTAAVVVGAALLATVAATAGYAHERTGSLALPAATYAAFVLAASVGWLAL